MLSEILKFIDYEALNGHTSIASSESTGRNPLFRQKVMERDQFCVVTGSNQRGCDAAHLIPRSKGDAVTFVVGFCTFLLTVSFHSISCMLFMSALPIMTHHDLSSQQSMTLGMGYC